MPYSFAGHTADVRMKVSGETLEELFRDALFGMVALMKPRKSESAKGVKKIISLDAADATALLVDFLNEALTMMQTGREAYDSVKFQSIGENSLEAEFEGETAESFGEDIKAVTYHEADVKKTDGVWETTLVFDI